MNSVTSALLMPCQLAGDSRLFPSVIADPELTQQQQQTLQINGREYDVASRTMMILNITAIGNHPKHWGQYPRLTTFALDPVVIRPSHMARA